MQAIGGDIDLTHKVVGGGVEVHHPGAGGDGAAAHPQAGACLLADTRSAAWCTGGAKRLADQPQIATNRECAEADDACGIDGHVTAAAAGRQHDVAARHQPQITGRRGAGRAGDEKGPGRSQIDAGTLQADGTAETVGAVGQRQGARSLQGGRATDMQAAAAGLADRTAAADTQVAVAVGGSDGEVGQAIAQGDGAASTHRGVAADAAGQGQGAASDQLKAGRADNEYRTSIAVGTVAEADAGGCRLQAGGTTHHERTAGRQGAGAGQDHITTSRQLAELQGVGVGDRNRTGAVDADHPSKVIAAVSQNQIGGSGAGSGAEAAAPPDPKGCGRALAQVCASADRQIATDRAAAQLQRVAVTQVEVAPAADAHRSAKVVAGVSKGDVGGAGGIGPLGSRAGAETGAAGHVKAHGAVPLADGAASHQVQVAAAAHERQGAKAQGAPTGDSCIAAERATQLQGIGIAQAQAACQNADGRAEVVAGIVEGDRSTGAQAGWAANDQRGACDLLNGAVAASGSDSQRPSNGGVAAEAQIAARCHRGGPPNRAAQAQSVAVAERQGGGADAQRPPKVDGVCEADVAGGRQCGSSTDLEAGARALADRCAAAQGQGPGQAGAAQGQGAAAGQSGGAAPADAERHIEGVAVAQVDAGSRDPHQPRKIVGGVGQGQGAAGIQGCGSRGRDRRAAGLADCVVAAGGGEAQGAAGTGVAQAEVAGRRQAQRAAGAEVCGRQSTASGHGQGPGVGRCADHVEGIGVVEADAAAAGADSQLPVIAGVIQRDGTAGQQGGGGAGDQSTALADAAATRQRQGAAAAQPAEEQVAAAADVGCGSAAAHTQSPAGLEVDRAGREADGAAIAAGVVSQRHRSARNGWARRD